MGETGTVATGTTGVLAGWRETLRDLLAESMSMRPGQVPALVRVALMGEDGALMSVEQVLADDVAREVLLLVLDHLLGRLQAVCDHFAEVVRLADGAALETSANEVKVTLLRERELLLPAIGIAEVLAEVLGSEGKEPTKRLRQYRKSTSCPDGKRAVAAVHAIVDVATGVERLIADACPGRGYPGERVLVDEECTTERGPYYPITEAEVEEIVRAMSRRLARSMGMDKALRLCGCLLVTLPESVQGLAGYDPELMEDGGFLDRKGMDAVSREGVWPELPWALAARGRRGYKHATMLLGGVVSPRSSQLMFGTYKTPAEPSTWLSGGLDVDVSKLLPSDGKAFIMDVCEPGEFAWVWPADSISSLAAALVGSLAGDKDAGEASWRRERWRWLRSSRDALTVSDGKALLTGDEVRMLEVGAGDELLVVGAGEYLEIWNPARWDEEQRRLNDEIDELAELFAVHGDADSPPSTEP